MSRGFLVFVLSRHSIFTTKWGDSCKPAIILTSTVPLLTYPKASLKFKNNSSIYNNSNYWFPWLSDFYFRFIHVHGDLSLKTYFTWRVCMLLSQFCVSSTTLLPTPEGNLLIKFSASLVQNSLNCFVVPRITLITSLFSQLAESCVPDSGQYKIEVFFLHIFLLLSNIKCISCFIHELRFGFMYNIFILFWL